MRDAEYSVMMVMEIPSLKTVPLRDLLYHKVYAFVGERTSTGDHCFDSWIRAGR